MVFLLSDRINKMNKMRSEKTGSSDSVDSVHSVENNGSAPHTLPNSRKVYVSGKLHPDLKVPFRDISLASTKTMSDEIEVNEPLRVYDTSGPWGDPNVDVDVTCGLPPLRADWIRARGDVEEIEGRKVLPLDDGYLSERHAASRNDDNRKLSAIRNPLQTVAREARQSGHAALVCTAGNRNA
ncbi:MAG: hypothetical protein DME75_04530 [Verrucomicrobia bacterium]|nr:MAG: hypothetical protein DME75_04530 [Verrucomicrobiota bacterium]